MRSGVIAQKVGMTRVFTDGGEHVPVTVLRLANCQVVAHRTKDKNGYVAVQLGSGTRRTEERDQGRARPFRRRQDRAQAQACGIPRRREGPDPGRRRDHRRSFRRRPVRRRHRHVDRQGLCRRHEALEFRRPARHATASRSRTARSVRPAAVRIPARPSRTRRCPATWASTASPRSISRWCRPTSSAASSWSRARCPGGKGGWITVRDAVKKALPKDVPKPGKFRLADAAAATTAGDAEAAQGGRVTWN